MRSRPNQEADRALPIGSPDEPVVVGIRQRRVHRLEGGGIEEQRAGGLNDGGPTSPPAAREAPLRPGQHALHPSAEREQDGADEEGDTDGRGADQLRIAGEPADEEATRAEREAEGHPPSASHGRTCFDTDRAVFGETLRLDLFTRSNLSAGRVTFRRTRVSVN